MSSQELIKDYLLELEQEVLALNSDSKVLFEMIQEYREWVDRDHLDEESDSFLDSLNMFEDVLDADILS